MSGPGLVADLLEGLGFPVRRVAQASLVLLAVVYFVSPATFRAGVNAWAASQAAQTERLVQDLVSQLDLRFPAPQPASPPKSPDRGRDRPQP